MRASVHVEGSVLLREAAEKIGLSFREVGERLTPPVSESTVSRWMSGSRVPSRPGWRQQLLRIFGIPLDAWTPKVKQEFLRQNPPGKPDPRQLALPGTERPR